MLWKGLAKRKIIISLKKYQSTYHVHKYEKKQNIVQNIKYIFHIYILRILKKINLIFNLKNRLKIITKTIF